MLDVQIRTTRETDKLLREMPKMIREGLVKGMNQVMALTEKYTKDSLGKPGKPRNVTGELRDSIRSSSKVVGNNLMGILSSDRVYSRIQEEGGTIRAKGGSYLTFPIGSGFVSVSSVRIPARPYLRPGIEDNLTKIEDLLTNSISKVFEE